MIEYRPFTLKGILHHVYIITNSDLSHASAFIYTEPETKEQRDLYVKVFRERQLEVFGEEIYPVETFKQTLELLMEKDPEFGDLCEDYNACVEALQHWVKSGKPEAGQRVTEYRTLVRELQEEIAQALTVQTPRCSD